MKAFILLGLLSISFAAFCPDDNLLPKRCMCRHYGPSGDEEKGSTYLFCYFLDQPTFGNLTKNLSGYAFSDLSFYAGTFTKLPEKAFENITIDTLKFDNTPISEVSVDAFAGIPHLKKIIMRNTTTTKVPNLKQVSHSLVGIVLDKNKIYKLDKDAFVDLIHLETILLRENNIQSIEDGVFHGLADLKEVDLSSNNLTDVGDWFEFNSTLEVLSLNKNVISKLPATFFPSLPNAWEIDLDDNNFSELPEEIFKDYIYDHYTSISIKGNPLICDEKLCWLYKRCRSLQPYCHVKGECKRPSKLKGFAFEDVPLSDVKCKWKPTN